MNPWTACSAPTRFRAIQMYALAQLNRRGVIPVFRGAFHMLLHEGIIIRLDEPYVSYRISAFATLAAHALNRNSWKGTTMYFAFREMFFEQDGNGTLLVVGGPALCPRCLGMCPRHKEQGLSDKVAS